MLEQLFRIDKNGYLTLSLGITDKKDIIEKADLVILEINRNAFRTHGDIQVHISKGDYIVEIDYPMPEISIVSIQPLNPTTRSKTAVPITITCFFIFRLFQYLQSQTAFSKHY